MLSFRATAVHCKSHDPCFASVCWASCKLVLAGWSQLSTSKQQHVSQTGRCRVVLGPWLRAPHLAWPRRFSDGSGEDPCRDPPPSHITHHDVRSSLLGRRWCCERRGSSSKRCLSRRGRRTWLLPTWKSFWPSSCRRRSRCLRSAGLGTDSSCKSLIAHGRW